jgi:hypothetical protein
MIYDHKSTPPAQLHVCDLLERGSSDISGWVIHFRSRNRALSSRDALRDQLMGKLPLGRRTRIRGQLTHHGRAGRTMARSGPTIAVRVLGLYEGRQAPSRGDSAVRRDGGHGRRSPVAAVEEWSSLTGRGRQRE